MLVLGIETTCDETAAAVIERAPDGAGKILSNIVWSQVEEHARFGGVVPEIAARAHVDLLDGIIDSAMTEAGIDFAQLDGVAAAAGPGLIGGVIVGLTTAKAIAMVHATPLVAVNHLEAHALTPRLTDALEFPYCLFLASGGHTQIVAVIGVGQYVRLGTTVDDAIGEAFDKVAKMLGLPYPGGPQVERAAASGDPSRFGFPRPLQGRPDRQLLAIGIEDGGAQRSKPVGRDHTAGRQRSLRELPGCRARFHRRPVERRSQTFPRAVRRTARACGGRRRRRQSGDPRRAA
ncbi:glycoprotease/Kae1 family metallohydrolase [Bradyrhizobium sp. F1.13.1]